MTYETLSALIGFAVVSSVTPGPNNLMLMTSGANFGFRRTIPHMAGISLGFGFMLVLVGIGLAQVFERWPVTLLILKIGSVAYLLYLAWKITKAGTPGDSEAAAKPFTFLQAAAFQWVNPKAWAMALSAISLYADSNNLFSIILVALIFLAVNFPNVSLWAFAGTKVQAFLSNQQRLHMFNWTMAILLVASVLPMALQ